MVSEARCLPIRHRPDVEAARREARALAVRCGFDRVDAERAALVVSELATNLLRYAEHGEIVLAPREHAGLPAVTLVSRDRGPGIADLDAALADGFSTGGGLGNGLPAARRLADEFAIRSSPAGTTVEVWLWPART